MITSGKNSVQAKSATPHSQSTTTPYLEQCLESSLTTKSTSAAINFVDDFDSLAGST